MRHHPQTPPLHHHRHTSRLVNWVTRLAQLWWLSVFDLKKTHWQKKFKITNQKKVKISSPVFLSHTHDHSIQKTTRIYNLFARIYSFSSRERLWYFEKNNNLLYYVTTDTTYWDIKTSTHTNKHYSYLADFDTRILIVPPRLNTDHSYLRTVTFFRVQKNKTCASVSWAKP